MPCVLWDDPSQCELHSGFDSSLRAFFVMLQFPVRLFLCAHARHIYNTQSSKAPHQSNLDVKARATATAARCQGVIYYLELGADQLHCKVHLAPFQKIQGGLIQNNLGGT